MPELGKRGALKNRLLSSSTQSTPTPLYYEGTHPPTRRHGSRRLQLLRRLQTPAAC
jgi:hypothetical protein